MTPTAWRAAQLIWSSQYGMRLYSSGDSQLAPAAERPTAGPVHDEVVQEGEDEEDEGELEREHDVVEPGRDALARAPLGERLEHALLREQRRAHVAVDPGVRRHVAACQLSGSARAVRQRRQRRQRRLTRRRGSACGTRSCSPRAPRATEGACSAQCPPCRRTGPSRRPSRSPATGQLGFLRTWTAWIPSSDRRRVGAGDGGRPPRGRSRGCC